MDGHKVTIKYRSLKSNLVNLPSNLSNLLFNANIKIQDVILEIVQSSGKKYYAGWSGMSSSTISTLEVDSIFAQSLSLQDNEAVTLNLKIRNFETSQIYLEPLTSSDWEVVELHAQAIEDKLLSQTRCVSLNQVLVVYPTQSTSAKLIVTDIGTKTHDYCKISPYCEIAIAPKVRVKKPNGSLKIGKPAKSTTEDYANMPSVLKRGISLPHELFSKLPVSANRHGLEIYANPKVRGSLDSEFVAVSVIPGPNSRTNSAPLQLQPTDEKDREKEKEKETNSVAIKENAKVIARLVFDKSCHTEMVGLSLKLAQSLNVEGSVGTIIVLKPAVKRMTGKVSTVIIHPYITQTRKAGQLNLNSTDQKKRKDEIQKQLIKKLFVGKEGFLNIPVTNYMKIESIADILPNGGLIRFKKNSDTNAWTTFDADRRMPRVELGEELLRSASFLEKRTLDDMGTDEAIGLEKTLDDIKESIFLTSNSGTLVHGNSGSGKSIVLKLLGKMVSQFGYHTKYVSCESLMNDGLNTLIGNFTKWFQECAWYKPSLLILDNLDKLLPAESEHSDTSNTLQMSEFFVAQIQKISNQQNSNVSILVSSESKESLNKLLFQSHVIENIFHLRAPDKNMRSKIILSFLTDRLKMTINFDILDLVSETEGYLPNDLKTLCERIYHESLFNQEELEGKLIINKSTFESAIKDFVPSNLRGVKLQGSSVNWSDIGGLKEAKNLLLETLEWPTRYGPVFANCPLRLRSGILLYGYPGCGKTLLASAVAGQCGLNFISIKGPEILNKYIGASEQSVRELFERAQSAKPCILFFDEFDSIAPKRGHDSTGVTDRVVNQMLTQMDGAEGLDGVYVLAATSRPDLIDSALLRPGRLDKSVICDMPDFENRLDILRCVTSKMKLQEDVDLRAIADRSAGFSGADIQGLGYNAYLKAVHTKLNRDEEMAVKGSTNSKEKSSHQFFQVNSDKLKNPHLLSAAKIKILHQIEQLFKDEDDANNLSNLHLMGSSLEIIISQVDFLESLKETKPSISVKEKQKLDKVYGEFVSQRDGNMPDGSASNEIGGRTTLM
ncbi:uncharacterized protein PRCAT00001798001 [Priceomyces carsonii]|uniref:uncharacterized protein n=1 Tax=Priceomyces carsonii TaxID=28549 RepID=UPI002ED778C9|nr:unnamed protein product [Priceomyces carsonii]